MLMEEVRGVIAVGLAVLGFMFGDPDLALAQPSGGDEATSQLRPKGHLSIERPGALSNEEALAVYQDIADELVSFYAMSQEPATVRYRRWQIYNLAPYLSATHGNRYVNNYANDRALNYGKLALGEKLPRGTILAKDSFTVTGEGEVFGAALFHLMEKLAPGASPNSPLIKWLFPALTPR